MFKLRLSCEEVGVRQQFGGWKFAQVVLCRAKMTTKRARLVVNRTQANTGERLE